MVSSIERFHCVYRAASWVPMVSSIHCHNLCKNYHVCCSLICDRMASHLAFLRGSPLGKGAPRHSVVHRIASSDVSHAVTAGGGAGHAFTRLHQCERDALPPLKSFSFVGWPKLEGTRGIRGCSRGRQGLRMWVKRTYVRTCINAEVNQSSLELL